MKRLLFLALAACTPVIAAEKAPSAKTSKGRPNIIFIFTDDHCEQALSAYDPSRITTPNMDRIAKEGMRFNRCYVTNSICGPSRAVILTGKYSHLNGFVRNGNTFNGEQPTFPKLLQKAGYQTAMIGKWHLKSTPTGFDHYEVLIGQGPYYNPPMKFRQPDGQPGTRKHTGYTTDIIGDLTIEWLKEKRDRDQPFLLMTQHKAPHRNWQPGPKYLTWLDDRTIPEPETLWDDYEGRTSAAREQKMEIKAHLSPGDLKLRTPGGLTPEQRKTWEAAYGPKNAAFEKARESMSEKEIIQWKYQRYVKDYLRCVKSVDDVVGRILDYLEEAGLAENTIVMYSSDQGWYLGEHGWYDKRWMYEESLKTPLLARWPGVIKPGTTNDAIVSNLDFPETFLDAAGVPVPGDMQGRSLVPLFEGKTPVDWRKSFYYHYYEFPGAHSVARHYGVTNGRHKLIHFYQKGEWELFDLEKDPEELQSVYGNSDYSAVQSALKAELDRLRAELKVPAEDPVRPPKEKRRGGKPKKAA
ncbi:MAG: sulfatase [Akkermansiaceae bacterium]|nr:sulfatase [Akkermansiaceae bacterium]NNM28741.1 sulfatase [Akkermansiaceae bacterium]